jgi:ATP-dependent Clp protease adaptor protein ClpS
LVVRQDNGAKRRRHSWKRGLLLTGQLSQSRRDRQMAAPRHATAGRQDFGCARRSHGPPYNCAMAKRTEHDHEHSHGVMVETSRPEIARPPLYSVLLLNDDYTPMDFVVEVLMRFFPMTVEKATQIMLHVHTRGRGVCGVFTREVAESKVAQVNEFSRLNQHPLMCTMERA